MVVDPYNPDSYQENIAKAKPAAVSIVHDKMRNELFISVSGDSVMSSFRISPEAAIEIGSWGNLAKVYREEMEAQNAAQG